MKLLYPDTMTLGYIKDFTERMHLNSRFAAAMRSRTRRHERTSTLDWVGVAKMASKFKRGHSQPS